MDSQFLQTGKAAIGDLRLRSGRVLSDVTIAYATAGTLNADRSNVVLVTHGFTSSHLFIGRAGPSASEGTWAGLVGSGHAIDTDRFFVVSSAILGSSFGSTSPASLNPETGRPYGLDFPDLTVSDIVEAQRLMLARLGIERLVAVVGPSYGGFQALTWAIDHPDALRGLSMSVSGLHAPEDTTAAALLEMFAADPNWNGGQHYERGGIPDTMTALRLKTMREYRVDVLLARQFPHPEALQQEMLRQAKAWARVIDPNAMIVLARAMESFNAEPHLDRIKARVQLVLSTTDDLFPASNAPGVMRAFARAGVAAEYFELVSDYGHHAAGTDSGKWAAELKRFLNAL